MLTETEKAYLAGFFDGEGCINIGTRKPTGCKTISYYLQIAIGQSDQNFLNRWRDRLDIGTVHEDKAADKKTVPMRKRSWTWRIYGQQAEDLLRLLMPFLDIKRKEAEIALAFRETKRMGFVGRRGVPQHIQDLRGECKKALHALKRGGDIPNLAELHELEKANEQQIRMPGLEST